MEKIKKRTINLSILTILIVASFLRLWLLRSVPPSPSLDEVSIGYNAFSLLHTGRDEYGYFLPLLLRAYDDWRPILYVYLTMPFVAVFGLSVLAVRLPSVILSIGTIYLSFRLIPILFKKDISFCGRELNINAIGLVTAFFVSISPWQIYLSRLGHEVNLGLFMTILSIYVFFEAVTKKRKYVFVLSAVFFSLCFYTYQSQKVIIPILLVALVCLYYKEIRKIGRVWVFALVAFLIVVIPAIVVSLSPEGMTRFTGTSVFSAEQSINGQAAREVLKAKNNHNFLGEVYYNRRFVPIRLVVGQYFSHFNPYWLFTGSLRENHKAPNTGLFYLFEAPILLVGIFVFLFSKADQRAKIFLVIWFLSSPLPAAITTDAPHALRSYTFIPSVQLLESVGLVFLYSFLNRRIYRFILSVVFACVVLFSLRQFSNNYFYVFPMTQSDSFQSTLLDSMQYLLKQKGQYDSVVISNEKNLYQSYMFYLFASSYNPRLYQSSGGTKSGGFAKEHTIGTIIFRPILWNTEKKQARIMYIGNREDFPGATIKKMFTYPDGKDGVAIVSYD